MSRTSTLNVSLSSRELKWVRQGINSGRFSSPNEIVKEGLRTLFNGDRGAKRKLPRPSGPSLAAAYKAAAAQDRKSAADWSALTEAWPEK
jgi:Arc/MetJ-type ribon-helix-helix transcriptional regulator